MKKDRIIFLIVIGVIILIIINTFQGGESRKDYISRIAKDRAEKDIFFSQNSESPFKGKKFTHLNYYPPNPDYKIDARFIRITDPQLIPLGTSDGKSKSYREFGYAEFELNGKTNRLLMLEMEEPYQNKLFIPFADETSTVETYGAGRYLEAAKPENNVIKLDFNLAYNPYCAYVENYSCPFPPAQNVLEIPIEAGEKKYHQN